MRLADETEGTPLPLRFRQGLVAAAVALFAVQLYWSLRAALLYTTDLGGVEGNVVYGILKLLRGLPLYEDPELPTFDVVQYTPLYYYIVAGIAKVIGLDPAAPQHTFILGRLVSLAFNLGTVAVVFRTVRQLDVPRWAALFWSLLVFTTLTRHFYARMDSLYLLLFMGSMGLLFRALGREDGRSQRRLLAWATVTACCAVLAKQTGVLALGIIGLQLLWQRRWKDLLAQVGIATVLLGAAFGALCLAYGGHVLRQNIVTGLRNNFSTEIFGYVFLTPDYLTVVGWHVAGLVLAVRMMRGGDPVRRAIGLSIAVSFVFALVTGLKAGSRVNYFMEDFLLVFIALSLLFHPSFRARRPLVLMVLLAYATVHSIAGVLRLHGDVVRIRTTQNGPSQYAKAAALTAHFKDVLHLAPGQYVLIMDRDFLEQFLIGHGVLDQKDILRYSPVDLYDYSAFFAAMEDGRVRYAVSQGRPDIAILGRTFPQFVPVDTVAGHILFRNRQAPGDAGMR